MRVRKNWEYEVKPTDDTHDEYPGVFHVDRVVAVYTGVRTPEGKYHMRMGQHDFFVSNKELIKEMGPKTRLRGKARDVLKLIVAAGDAGITLSEIGRRLSGVPTILRKYKSTSFYGTVYEMCDPDSCPAKTGVRTVKRVFAEAHGLEIEREHYCDSMYVLVKRPYRRLGLITRDPGKPYTRRRYYATPLGRAVLYDQ